MRKGKNMLALVKDGKGRDGVGLKDVSEPLPKNDEIKIEVYAGGICGTDLHMINDIYRTAWPVILGHEFSGTVVETGKDVESFKKGDRVISLSAIHSCGKCEYCYAGLNIFCSEKASIGSLRNGAFAKYLVVPADKALIIPDGVSMDEAALAEPLACAVRSVIEHSEIKAGDYVAITGPGTMGNLAMQLTIACGGIALMIGTKSDASRLELAKNMGAKAVFYAEDSDTMKNIDIATGGQGVDVVIECSGSAHAAQLCLELVKPMGRYTQTGLFGKKIEIDMDLVVYKGIRLWSGYASERTSWVRAIRLIEHKMVNLAPLINAKLPLSEWKKGMELTENKEALKVLLLP
jgi:L-iditol 2-dehydrogenase